MNIDKIIALISDSLSEIRYKSTKNAQIYSDENATGKNEFLFFIKPEITKNDTSINFKDILNLILSKIEWFNLTIKSIRIINARYLEKYNIIAEHYGVINKLSNNIQETISEDAKLKFEQLYRIKFQNAKVLGSLEFMKAYPEFTPLGLSYVWQNSPTEKLSGGTYSQKLNLDGEEVYIINGFHPRQLAHFTQEGQCIIAMTLDGDLSWAKARNEFIGKTNPEDAMQGSIRRELLDKKDGLGLASVSSSFNGVHLSAGPIEGLVELIRYNSDLEAGKYSTPNDYKYGRKLINSFGEEKTKKLLKNPNLIFGGKSISVFDLTEEKDSDEGINLILNCEF